MTSTTKMKERYSELKVGVTKLIYKDSDNKILITKSALDNLEFDMRRDYETAGFLLGHEISGKVVFDTYVPRKGIIRHRYSVYITQSDIHEEQMTEFKSQGYDSIAFVHLHPPDKNNILVVYEKQILYDKYVVTNSHLNQSDRNFAINFDYPEAKALGFKNVFSGVFIVKFHNTIDNRTAILTLYDCSQGAEKIEDFSIVEDNKEVVNGLKKLRRLGEDITKLGQGITLQVRDNLLTHVGLIEYKADKVDSNALHKMLENLKLPKKYVQVVEEGSKIFIVVYSTIFTRIFRLDESIKSKVKDIESKVKELGGRRIGLGS